MFLNILVFLESITFLLTIIIFVMFGSTASTDKFGLTPLCSFDGAFLTKCCQEFSERGKKSHLALFCSLYSLYQQQLPKKNYHIPTTLMNIVDNTLTNITL